MAILSFLNWQSRMTCAVLLVGIALRVALFVALPPSTAYDNHFRVIEIVHKEHRVPRPDECWECYQPPLYYLVTSVVYAGGESIDPHATDSDHPSAVARKCVQSVSLLAGCATLIISLLILRRVFPTDPHLEAICMGVICVLPQHVVMSAMVTNDALTYLIASLAIWTFLGARQSVRLFWIISSAVFTGASVLCKGYGWMTFAAVFLILAGGVIRNPPFWKKFAIWTVISTAVAIFPAIRNFHLYRHIHVDNFNFFPNTPMASQPPGSSDQIEFSTFRLSSLLSHPWLHKSHSASFWTGLYARYWFDYEGLSITLHRSPEWRAFTKGLRLEGQSPTREDWERRLDWPPTAVPAELRRIAQAAYLAGIPISLTIIAGFFRTLLRRRDFALLLISLHLLTCLFVPIFQTLRLPIFSAMKPVFTLSAISSIPVLIAVCLDRLHKPWQVIARSLLASAVLILAVTDIVWIHWIVRHP